MQVYWIASYPRSGNTFLRIVLHRLFFDARSNLLDDRLPEYDPGNSIEFIAKAERISESTGVVWGKTHAPAPLESPSVKTRGACYIYRHPLDVFLSGLNYIYLQADNSRFREYFIEGIPKSVKQIAHDGELGHYFDLFLREDGLQPFEAFSGKLSENLQSWAERHWSDPQRILIVNYGRLVSDTEEVIKQLLQSAEIDRPDAEIVKAVEFARAVTKPDGAFYWRGEGGTFRKYLTAEQIDMYFNRYETTWRRFGIEYQR
ncbi:sulfotransferase domain-containing protein [Sphingobium sp. SYK-6]|uniref:sulfotransferase domain-containing protein n=1 Tax=Sphingobium sp. (strain NBRC 103272 / SYK-6) TaxID=627192 RepID=UPI001314EDE0|nr:sulfotransferase domain-containing protein [Sphingobium sp. SYK-6]